MSSRCMSASVRVQRPLGPTSPPRGDGRGKEGGASFSPSTIAPEAEPSDRGGEVAFETVQVLRIPGGTRVEAWREIALVVVQVLSKY